MNSDLEAGAGAGLESVEVLRRENFATLLEILEQYLPLAGSRILEVGCGEGLFLRLAVNKGASVVGLEPCEEQAERARHSGFDVRDGYFPQAIPVVEGGFDGIVFNDVFEHLPEPVEALEMCWQLIRPVGYLVLNMPDSDGTLYRVAQALSQVQVDALLERLWQKGFPSPHISYFNADNLALLVERDGRFRLSCSRHLRAVHLDGLRDRIRSTVKQPWATALYLGLVLGSPLLKMLPQDISLLIFERR